MGAEKLSRPDFVWLIGSLCQVNRLPFDAALLLQNFPAPHSVRQLIEALQSLGFRTGESKLAKASFPCIAILKGETPRAAIVVKADASQLLYFEAGSQAPQTCPLSELERFEARALLVRHEQAQKLEGDDAAAANAFGFRWFWRELLKHKRIWRDVLLASLFIQLVALATPLFTQVVIDKVVVHQTTNTLIVIAIALGMFLVFNAGMSWLRQFRLSGSDDSALGGDLAYWYGKNGGLGGISLQAAQQVIGASGFGQDAQALRPFSGLQDGFVKLS